MSVRFASSRDEGEGRPQAPSQATTSHHNPSMASMRTISPIRRPSSATPDQPSASFHPRIQHRRPTLSHDGSINIKPNLTSATDHYHHSASYHPQPQQQHHHYHHYHHHYSLQPHPNRTQDSSPLNPSNNHHHHHHNHHHNHQSIFQPSSNTNHSSRPISASVPSRPRTQSLNREPIIPSLPHQQPSTPPLATSSPHTPHTSNLNNHSGGSHQQLPRSWVIPLNVHHPHSARGSIASVKKSLIQTIDSFPCSLKEKLILLSKLHSEVQAELTQLDGYSGGMLHTNPTNHHHQNNKKVEIGPKEEKEELRIRKEVGVRLKDKVNPETR